MTTIDPGYYVTVREAKRVGFLAGPYGTHVEALSMVDEAARRAKEADAWADFYAFGTSRVKAPLTLRRGGVTFGRMKEDTHAKPKTAPKKIRTKRRK